VKDPSFPLEFRERLVADAAARVRIDVARLVAQVASSLRGSDGRRDIIEAEELATHAVDDIWCAEDLADAYARALTDIREQYLADAVRVQEVAASLEADGRDSWVASALRYHFAFDVAWKALGRLGVLNRFPNEALCAACGAELGDGADGGDA
jgi:hypothetical protein